MRTAFQSLFDQACVRVLILFGQRHAAIARLGHMLARDPNDAYALASRSQLRWQLGMKHEAIDDMQLAALATPSDSARASHAWYNLGYLLNEIGRTDEAEAPFRKALNLNPQLDLAWYGLSLVLIHQRRFDEAVASLKQNTKLQPMSPYGWYQLARVHVDRKAPDEAERVIRHLRGFEPKIADQLVRETGIRA